MMIFLFIYSAVYRASLLFLVTELNGEKLVKREEIFIFMFLLYFFYVEVIKLCSALGKL